MKPNISLLLSAEIGTTERIIGEKVSQTRVFCAFDALNAPSTATEFILGLLFHPERANRMVHQKALFERQLGLGELIDEVFNTSFKKNYSNRYDYEIQQRINNI